MIDRQGQALLGRHEVRRPQNRSRLGHLLGRAQLGLRQAEVGDLHRSVGGQKQVRRFNVAMHESRTVGRGQALARFGNNSGRLQHRAWAVGVEFVLDRSPGDKLHDQILKVAFLADLVNGDGVRVVQFSGRSGFDQKPLEKSFVTRHRPRQHLDRHIAIDERVSAPWKTTPLPWPPAQKLLDVVPRPAGRSRPTP